MVAAFALTLGLKCLNFRYVREEKQEPMSLMWVLSFVRRALDSLRSEVETHVIIYGQCILRETVRSSMNRT